MAFAAMLTGSVAVGATAAAALPRVETVSFPGGVNISIFELPGGTRAYCVEIIMGEPTGHAWLDGRVTSLPGRAGLLNSWGDPNGMRQMNYLIDKYGQSTSAWTAAALQLTIWRMRENFGQGNPQLNRTISALEGSSRGRELIARSDKMYETAKTNATAPVAAPSILGSLKLTPDPAGKPGRYIVSFPKGTTSLSVTGAKFSRDGSTKLSVSSSSASERAVDATAGATRIKVTGTWETKGKAGWEPKLDVYGTLTAAGDPGQRVAVSIGKAAQPKKQGTFAATTVTLPPPLAPPTASSQAQPSAEVGGTMTDELRVRAQKQTTLEMWPGATASFTAYLYPVVGTPKYSPVWETQLGEPYEAQAEDPVTGQPLWYTWWADSEGAALLDSDGNQIAAADEQGVATEGVDANGLAYPVPQLDENDESVLDDEGNPVFYSARTPVLEERRDPERWTEQELSALSEKDRCLAQPVFHDEGIPVPGPGNYSSAPAAVRSEGTVHWVERVYSQGTLKHEGVCGLPNETTRINQPGVVTQAPADLRIGDEAYDTATVSGRLLPDVSYTLMFEAYRADDVAAAATCTPESIVFRSDRVPVTGTGEVRSPGFKVTPAHGVALWWVETLEIDEGDGPRVLHRGACGLENETSRIAHPSVETLAMPDAIVGDYLTDTAILSGDFAATEGTRWELEFKGYRGAPAATEEPEPEIASVAEADDEHAAESAEDEALTDKNETPAVCDASNLLFEVPAIEVTGPGEVVSEGVFARPEWQGEIWWVETLWLIQGDERVPFSVGECGIANETTFLTGATVTTQAMPLASIGDEMTDTAIVEGELSARDGVHHEITFEAYQGEASLTGTELAECGVENLIWGSDPVLVEGPGSYESSPLTALPAYGSDVWWVESLWLVEPEQEKQLLHRGDCGVEHETTRLQRPDVSTVATSTVTVGDPVYDTALVEGALSVREDIEFWVRFTAYERPREGAMVCTPDTEIVALSDTVGVRVPKPGTYRSKEVTALPEHVGLGGYVETLVLIENGEEYEVHRGECGAERENFEIVPVVTPPDAPPVTPPSAPPAIPPVPRAPGDPELPRTGFENREFIVIGGAVLVLGLAACGLGMARKNRKKS
ncbi:hypothetical protein JOF28_000065 [Leucobacter exalbidus]|uniref:Gram-positive cocci surface proteins LPxTG domain-containing protein n=1 Tax=Leucobacter exalbidus TaxID=662960 RepID=A0A940PKR5_9MICO|nr:hypothetical protein [Leucobacter exalbidus]MBP1324833.1 hypothetical protein [Leucobacter exalbidus]